MTRPNVRVWWRKLPATLQLFVIILALLGSVYGSGRIAGDRAATRDREMASLPPRVSAIEHRLTAHDSLTRKYTAIIDRNSRAIQQNSESIARLKTLTAQVDSVGSSVTGISRRLDLVLCLQEAQAGRRTWQSCGRLDP